VRALRTTTRVTATLTAAGVMALTAGPGFAADTTVVAQSEAEAIYLQLGPQVLSDQLSGAYRAERTAQGETTEGNNQPNARLLTGQPSLKAGVLAQDAQTGLAGNRGVSEACSGVAGNDATFVGVGEDGTCLDPGDDAEIALTPGGLNLVKLAQVELVDGTGTSLETIVGGLPGADQVLRNLNRNLRDLLRDFDAGLFASLSAITSECTAGPGQAATGDARLAGLDVFLRLPEGAPQREVSLVDNLQSDPEPNTEVFTEISKVVDPLLDQIVRSLPLPNRLSGLTEPLTEQLRQAVREQLLQQIETQLGPVEDNLLDGTLNKQTRAPGEIEVTAIDLKVLPAIEPSAGFNGAEIRLARSQCGPGATLTDTPTTPTDPDSPEVPRVVPAGVGTPLDGVAARGNDATVPAALALLALMTFGSAVGFSTSRSRADA